ncbi:hypothetical protein D3C86_1517260 [compost metagenome]
MALVVRRDDHRARAIAPQKRQHDIRADRQGRGKAKLGQPGCRGYLQRSLVLHRLYRAVVFLRRDTSDTQQPGNTGCGMSEELFHVLNPASCE